jgi:23S rRNA pseudouridine1911/1915/1917 synthase
VPAGPLRQRADKVLAAVFPEHSRVALQRAFDAGHVRLAGVVISRDHTVHPGDFLELDFPDVKPAELRPVKIPLSVLFEDRHLLVVNKAAMRSRHASITRIIADLTAAVGESANATP